MSDKAKTCVIVSYWAARPKKHLDRLLRQMMAKKFDAGCPFDLVVSCNGGDLKPLKLSSEFNPLRPRVLNRENSDWNLGAWDYGWRMAGPYDYFLFLQDDCYLKHRNWVYEFQFRAENDAGIGLLGETIMWDKMTWPFIRKATDRDLGPPAWPEDEPIHPLDTYQELLRKRGVSIGEIGTHLPSLILYSPRKVLEEVGGFPLMGSTYRQAVACEIGISRVIEAKGYRISKVKDDSFQLIGHPQWTPQARRREILRNKAVAFLKKLGIRRPRRKRYWLPNSPDRVPPTY
jgi:hypothetical protein